MGRKRLLVAGWLIGIPVPLILIWAPSWSWVLFANVLLGTNQALTWSMTVVMKVDLATPRTFGLVIGWNEFAGYAGMAAIAALTGAAIIFAAPFGTVHAQEVGTDDFRITSGGTDGNASTDMTEADIAYNATNDEYLVVFKGDTAVDNRTLRPHQPTIIHVEKTPPSG